MSVDFSIREKEIYMDNAATTVIDGAVVEAMHPYLEERYGNPETPYQLGREAKDAIEKAREQIANLAGCNSREIFFTSGGTEANNWAIKGFDYKDRKKLIVSAIEHKSVLEPAKWLLKRGIISELIELPVDGTGMISVDALESYLKAGDVGLVSIQYANNEVGTLQPVKEIAKLCAKYGTHFHCDAVQAFGKVKFDVVEDSIDMMSLSAHKIHGPMGVGALYVRLGTSLEPLLHGGGHELGMRSGTHGVQNIVGFGEATDVAWANLSKEMPRLSKMVEWLSGELKIKFDAIRNGHPTKRLPNILNVTLPKEDAAVVCGVLGRHGIFVSTGSACGAKDIKSHVLMAMGRKYTDCTSTLRISLSKYNTDSDAKMFVARLQGAVLEAKGRSLL